MCPSPPPLPNGIPSSFSLSDKVYLRTYLCEPLHSVSKNCYSLHNVRSLTFINIYTYIVLKIYTYIASYIVLEKQVSFYSHACCTSCTLGRFPVKPFSTRRTYGKFKVHLNVTYAINTWEMYRILLKIAE